MSQPMGVIAPPEGIIPDFENPVRKAQYVYVLSGIGMALSTAFMIMRVYTKAHINRTFASEDGWPFLSSDVSQLNLKLTMLCSLRNPSLGTPLNALHQSWTLS